MRSGEETRHDRQTVASSARLAAGGQPGVRQPSRVASAAREDADDAAARRELEAIVSARRARVSCVLMGLALLVVLLAVLNLSLGTVAIAPDELVRIVLGGDAGTAASQVIWNIRLPRLIAAGLMGASLALAGLLLQTFFNNPIAGPYILGISSGAKLAVAATMIVVVGSHATMSSWMLVAAACVGSLGATACVLALSRRLSSAAQLIVAGVMIGYVCSAATDFLVTFASDANIVNLRSWSMGSFSGVSWADVRIASVVLALASVGVFLLAKPLGAYQLGEHYAQAAGVNVRAFRVCLIVLSSVLAACVTAYAGPVSFVGVAVPHVVRRLMGSSRPLVVIPAAFLGGAAFCLFCDLVARLACAPTELSISAVTALFGAPVVIAMLMGRTREVGV